MDNDLHIYNCEIRDEFNGCDCDDIRECKEHNPNIKNYDTVTYLDVLKVMSLENLVDETGKPQNDIGADLGDAEYTHYYGFAIFQHSENELHINCVFNVYPYESYIEYGIVLTENKLKVHHRENMDLLSVIAVFRADNIKEVFNEFVNHKTITGDMEYQDKIIKRSTQWLNDLKATDSKEASEKAKVLDELLYYYKTIKKYY